MLCKGCAAYFFCLVGIILFLSACICFLAATAGFGRLPRVEVCHIPCPLIFRILLFIKPSDDVDGMVFGNRSIACLYSTTYSNSQSPLIFPGAHYDLSFYTDYPTGVGGMWQTKIFPEKQSRYPLLVRFRAHGNDKHYKPGMFRCKRRGYTYI